ncbi:metallophosphoesterase [Paenisporosarcina cavernae]|uniref:Calcineurin-like phosphoesterase domain-containing protein n=1 Tax=Paenisporosarcina cavernae TaxID=2320858 RepID=A0A385YTW5_9BACL|nr:metallophosphoesterase [Paenisporosarcina cavernae]AYC29367.1 hypothetical protein D3873_05520 [Paenisporosarcina cavernae]
MQIVGILLFVCIALVALMFFLAHFAVIRHHKVASPIPIEEDIKLFFISDIHHRKISKQLLKKIKDSVDFIIIGGDLTEESVPIKKTEENIRLLTGIAPTYFVYGNNDREVGEHKLESILMKYHVEILSNRCVKIDGHSLQLVGIDDTTAGLSNITQAFENCHSDIPIVFISHTPAIIRKVMENYHPFLCLSGHTHGGQIRLGKWGLQDLGSFERKDGYFQLISNGYGTTFLPFRFGAIAECHIMTITS